MAQGTKCLHAIWNYMRKVKLKYQHVLPTTPCLIMYLLSFTYRTLAYLLAENCRFVAGHCIVELKLKVKNYKEANGIQPRGTFILELSVDVI